MSFKFQEIESINESQSNIPCVSIDNVKNNQKSNNSIGSNSSLDCLNATSSIIKKQFVIENVGHFKYNINNTVVINFIDKVKLYMDEYSMQMFQKNNMDKCSCWIYLPDSSQHEIYLNDEKVSSSYFGRYLSFLDQWLQWLVDAHAITTTNREAKPLVSQEDPVNISSMQAHLSSLKLFNYTIKQDFDEQKLDDNSAAFVNLNIMSVSSLLKENTKFLQNISK